MLIKMTKGQLVALTAILKANTARSSGDSLSADDIGKYGGIEPQLVVDVVLVVVEFMYSGSVTQMFFVPRSSPINEKLFVWRVFTANLFVFQIYPI